MEATFWMDQGWLKATRPMTASGILFNEPTRPKVVAVVVLRNLHTATAVRSRPLAEECR